MLDVLRIQGRNGAMALLESLMIHYPKLYTQITGRKPSIESSGFSGLIKTSELTEYLVRAVTGMQRELQEARQQASVLSARCTELQAELSQALQRAEEQQRLQTEHGRLRSHMAGLHRDVLKLKDEKCDLYMRYTAAIEENSAVNIRYRELQLQLYQLQFELRKAQTETDFQRQQSLKYSKSVEMQELREEVSVLRRKLLEAEKFTPAREDILVKDLEEARDGRMELVEQIHRLQEETERLASERDQLLEEKECLALQVQKLSLDCEMYQQKSALIQSQMEELQQERDQAYLARDEAQGQIARSLAEKDTLRGQLVELQEKLFALRVQSNQGVAQSEQKERKFSWEMSPQSSSEDPLPSTRPRLRLCRMDAICPDYMKTMESIGSFNSFRSVCAEPPGAESLRRRQLEENSSLDISRWDSQPSLSDLESEYVFISDGDEDGTAPLPSPLSNNMSPSDGEAVPPFLIRSRPKALRLCATSRVLTISFQGEALLSQLEVIGGNKTGVFIHHVKEGSAAQNVGLSPGAQIMEVQYEQGQQSLRMVLEDSTMEEALWALGQVRGFCSVSVRPNQDAYEKLLLQLQGGEVTTGDSFYVRVNLSLPGGATGALAVKCNDILQVTDTRQGAKGFWQASHVHPCNLKNLKCGTVPNYYRAQRLLIRAIEDMTQFNPQKRMDRCQSREEQKAVRIVSTGRVGHNPLWMCVVEDRAGENKEGESSAPGGCITLMPYTLVTPHHPPASRPVLLLPTIHGLIMNKRLGEQPGFQLCEPEVLSASECADRMQKAEILDNCGQVACPCYTVQSVEKVIKQGLHCVLPLGLDCVRRLHRAEIFPIVIFITSSDRSVRKLRHKLHRQGLTEEQLLECSRNEKPLLDKLPCLYRTVPPDSWSDSATLLAMLRTIVLEEQSKIVWVEPDLW
ncbi:caspase recruitment domain-containing protein 14 isoform X2 [Scleropages formosus]|nr:caspase recruitment domain-containing protein 14 isoform X2 [Scleropages formosus]